MKDRVLLIEDDEALRMALTQTLELADLTVIQANGLDQARRTIRANFPGVVLSDLRMPQHDGFSVLERVKSVDPELPVIFLTGEADVPSAVQALQHGVYDFLEKPCSVDTLLSVLHRALKHREIVLQARRLETILEHSDAAAIHFPGRTTASTQLRSDIRRLSRLSVHVHFHGEEGAGKRLAAYTLQLVSGHEGPVVAINLRDGKGLENAPEDRIDPEAAPPLLLLKNIHLARGAALEQIGHLISQLSPGRILSTGIDPLDRTDAASAYLAVDSAPVNVAVPNLLQRSADLPIIFEGLVRIAARNLDTDMPEISAATLSEVAGRTWPGNLPELRRHARDMVLGLSQGPPEDEQPGLVEQVQTFEKSLILDALKRANGQASRAAEELKLPRKTFYDKLSKYDIEPKQLKTGGQGSGQDG
ncbi:MAG: response regulator [Pseudomonadota bacterium]